VLFNRDGPSLTQGGGVKLNLSECKEILRKLQIFHLRTTGVLMQVNSVNEGAL
jgi:hypothetical protein